jgi:hypothetical protein
VRYSRGFRCRRRESAAWVAGYPQNTSGSRARRANWVNDAPISSAGPRGRHCVPGGPLATVPAEAPHWMRTRPAYVKFHSFQYRLFSFQRWLRMDQVFNCFGGRTHTTMILMVETPRHYTVTELTPPHGRFSKRLHLQLSSAKSQPQTALLRHVHFHRHRIAASPPSRSCARRRYAHDGKSHVSGFITGEVRGTYPD